MNNYTMNPSTIEELKEELDIYRLENKELTSELKEKTELILLMKTHGQWDMFCKDKDHLKMDELYWKHFPAKRR